MLRSTTSQLIRRLNPRAASTLWDVAGGNPGRSRRESPTIFISASTPRFFSSGNDNNDISSTSTVDETLNRLFEDNKLAEAPTPTDEVWSAGATTMAEFEPSSWYNLADQSIVMLEQIHGITGFDYGLSIIVLTTGLRLTLLPIMGMAQQTQSRMAHVQPELQQLQKNIQRLGTPTRAEQMQFAAQYKGLFKKYQIRPMWAFLAPALQLPIFAALFFGLRKLPDLFPAELSNAGMYWFPDLTQPDPTYILPILSSAAVLAMFEISKKQVAAQSPGAQGEMLINFFRLMAVMMIPVTITFNTSVLLMWTTNSTLMLVQTSLFQTSTVRRAFGIWDLPKPVPGQEPKGIMDSVSTLVKRVQGEAVTDTQKIKRHNKEVETRKASFRMARERRRKKGITGTRNY